VVISFSGYPVGTVELMASQLFTGQQIFGLVFFYFDFLVFLDVFWCAESENDVFS